MAAMPAADSPHRNMFPDAAAALGLSWKMSTRRVLKVCAKRNKLERVDGQMKRLEPRHVTYLDNASLEETEKEVEN